MKKYLAYLVCKISNKLLGLINKGGSLPGELALKIEPNILSKIKFPKKVILVTATNGKTSTTNLIANILNDTDQKVIYNHKGDNLIYGIVTLLLKNADYRLNVSADVAVIEIDELTLAKIAAQIDATHILINNFFRDQLDRSGEMENIVSKIENALVNYQGILILNHDDPNVLRIANKVSKAKIITYHLSQNNESTTDNNEASEGKFCPLCHKQIVYDFYQYSHIGKYHCENCGFGKQSPTFVAKMLDEKKFMVLNQEYQCFAEGLYNIYNCLATVVLCNHLNINYDIIYRNILNFKLSLGRNELLNLKDKQCHLNLVKNPTGCNEILKLLAKNPETKTLLFVLNDNPQDSTDVSWIWDVDFEHLKNVDKIICSGKRAYEIALRLKYGNIECELEVVESIANAVKSLYDSNTHLYVLSTYTALPVVRKEILSWN